MRILEGLALRELLGEHIITGESVARVDFSKVISLNDSAAYLWESVQGKDFTMDDLVRLLTERYEVSEQTAREDAGKLIDSWREAGLIEG